MASPVPMPMPLAMLMDSILSDGGVCGRHKTERPYNLCRFFVHVRIRVSHSNKCVDSLLVFGSVGSSWNTASVATDTGLRRRTTAQLSLSW